MGGGLASTPGRGSEKEGQPVPESNLDSDEKSPSPHLTIT